MGQYYWLPSFTKPCLVKECIGFLFYFLRRSFDGIVRMQVFLASCNKARNNTSGALEQRRPFLSIFLFLLYGRNLTVSHSAWYCSILGIQSAVLLLITSTDVAETGSTNPRNFLLDYIRFRSVIQGGISKSRL